MAFRFVSTKIINEGVCHIHHIEHCAAKFGKCPTVNDCVKKDVLIIAENRRKKRRASMKDTRI